MGTKSARSTHTSAVEITGLRNRVAELEECLRQQQVTQDERARVEHHLRERVKELRCLYGIAQIGDRSTSSLDRILQAVVELLPPSWQYPEVTCARVVFAGKEYVTRGFRRTRQNQSADILVEGSREGQVEVYYLKKMPQADEGPFIREERELLNAVAERLGRIAERFRAAEELRQTHDALQVERAALHEANAALRALLARMEDEKRSIREAVVANVERIVLPILHALELEATPAQEQYVALLKRSLGEIVSPFVDRLARAYLSLTPAEIQICNMIKTGLTTKEIARLRHVSPATVCRHREHIRKKLGIANTDVNLVTYLQTAVARQA